ncbi:bacteriocin immunity protein [Lacticaseibacillus chiayiensis]|uniref:Bacteriocin immunity protein n=1 Tax=Lacticaseibacillus chiayiensis TaxID=2100821 RepID=A0A4Q1UHK2_9LACO|nr:bacteriocin immunity protein [Lacticaseibacillus chiayiensis]RXT30687.1 bacteriocin immunity protein [Lacticaseibacillus chiayiensis]UYN56355.1 bacteriocin immunity protein [Lacticaseibacillus chiayiensis]
MGSLKWYAGGSDRAEQAIRIIDELFRELEGDSQTEPLQQMLRKYKDALVQTQAAVPFILSRMNMEILNVLICNKITLAKPQSDKIGQLSSLLNIRYGY